MPSLRDPVTTRSLRVRYDERANLRGGYDCPAQRVFGEPFCAGREAQKFVLAERLGEKVASRNYGGAFGE